MFLWLKQPRVAVSPTLCDAGTPSIGVPGTPGTPGTPGPPGADGTPGKAGTPGTPGTQGMAGLNGTPGTPGSPGARANKQSVSVTVADCVDDQPCAMSRSQDACSWPHDSACALQGPQASARLVYLEHQEFPVLQAKTVLLELPARREHLACPASMVSQVQA